MRIVTLAPALTKMVMDLGLGDRIVGVAQHDMAAPPGLPIVGQYAGVDEETLLATRPTVVLTMTTSHQPPAALRNLAAAVPFELVAYPYPNTIAEVANILAPPPPEGVGFRDSGRRTLGDVLHCQAQARALRQKMLEALAQLRQQTAKLDHPRTLLVIGLHPLMASGPGTVLDELLRLVGGRNAAADSIVTAPTYDREALLAMQPRVIVLLMPDAPPLQANDGRLAAWRGLPIPAVAHHRVVLINDPMTLLPSTSLPEVAKKLAAAVHGKPVSHR